MENITFICLSLVTREDRQQHMRRFFKKLGLQNILFWIVDKHPTSGIYGCFESHWSIWKNSDIKTEWVCVFEDDIDVFDKRSRKRFFRLLNYLTLSVDEDWDVDMINLEPGGGYYNEESIFFSKYPEDELRGGFTTRTGCYIGQKKKLELLADKIRGDYGIDIDVALYGKCKMMSTVVPIFRQNKDLGTDNTGNYHDYFAHPSNNGIDYSRVLLSQVPLLAHIYLSGFQMGCNVLTYNKKNDVELIDRRV